MKQHLYTVAVGTYNRLLHGEERETPALIEPSHNSQDTPDLLYIYPRSGYVGGYKIPINQEDFPQEIHTDPEKVKLLAEDNGKHLRFSLPFRCDCCGKEPTHITITAEKLSYLKNIQPTCDPDTKQPVCKDCALTIEGTLIQTILEEKPEYLVSHRL